jgi:hypothetical protein
MLGMRALDWVRDFLRWRWAPCVGLITGSLAFIALVLLLIPAPTAVATRAALTFPTFDRPRAVLPPHAAFNASLARDAVPEPAAHEQITEASAEATSTALVTSQTHIHVQPDFSANIADRGDRPQALPPR